MNLLESLLCFTYRIINMRRDIFRYVSNFRELAGGGVLCCLSSVEPDLVWLFNYPKAAMSELKFHDK